MNRPHGKTVITIETFQRTTIRSRKAADFVRCEQCAADAPSHAAAHLQKTCDVLYLAGIEDATALAGQTFETSGCRHSVDPAIDDQPP